MLYEVITRIMIHVNGPAEARIDGMTLEEIRPDGTSQEARYTGESSETRFMRRWVELYHGEGRPWLQHGRILHPPRCICKSQEYRDQKVPDVFHVITSYSIHYTKLYECFAS